MKQLIDYCFDKSKDEYRSDCKDCNKKYRKVYHQRIKVKESRADQAALEEEVQAWIVAGILVPWNKQEHGVIWNVVPLMSINQQKGETSKV